MSKRMLGVLLLGMFLLAVLGGCVESASQQAQAPQANPGKNNPAMYIIGNGKVGLFHNKLTLDEVKKLITGVYGGRLSEAREPAGEGTTARVVSAYFNGAPDHAPSIKITLDNDGNIYRIEALSPEFKTTKGLHVGSTWAEIRSMYPQAKVTVEEIIAFHAPEDVTCRLSTQANPNWQKIKAGHENPPDDLKIIGLFTYTR
ncbi:MAG: hypothetical protein AB9917_18195 [Negativicutes bacterium]